MISRMVRVQLVVFVLVSLVSVAVIAVVYARTPAMLGIGEREIGARFTDAGGLYDAARVTYRGVDIGQVTRVTADRDGVEATMSVDESYHLPDDVRAQVRSVSAIGEQYVDLTSARGDGPFLEEGAVIPVGRTSIPKPIGEVLASTSDLLASLPPEKIEVTLRELSDGFRDTGPGLQRLLDGGMALLETADQHFAGTEGLIRNLEPVLATQGSHSVQIRSLVDSLASFTGRVRESDADLRSVLDHGGPAAAQVSGLVEQLRPTLPVLLANMINVEEVLVTYNPGLEQVLVVYPMFTAALISATQPHQDDQAIALGLRLSVSDPPACAKGYLPPEQQRDPADEADTTTPAGLHCSIPQDDPSVVRGARNLPCMEVPGKRATTPAECRGPGYTPTFSDNPAFPEGSPLGGLATGTYDPISGSAVASDGRFFAIGGVGSGTPRQEERTWQRMLLTPAGL